MAIGIACPNCLKVVLASRKEAGITKPCPGCGQHLNIPPRHSYSAEKVMKLNCVQCSQEFRLVKSLHGRHVRCDKCGIELLISAHPWKLSAVNGQDSGSNSPGMTDAEERDIPSLEEFLRRLIASGLISADEFQPFMESLIESDRPQTSQELIELLCRRGMLTRFQAGALCDKKIRRLVLGNYALLDPLGQGGMGRVYRAKHLRMDRTVAIKLLPKSATKSPWAVKCFQRELRAAAKLSHPNIVMAHDADEADGVHFLVMEYIDGQDLGSLVAKNGPLTVTDAVNYLLQTAHGLEYAHDKGIIHRDIKPANLLLDKSGNIKILDMGLAHVNDGEIASDLGKTENSDNSGHVMGTLEYMSPEQALDPNLASPQSDIYCLGCTLYYLLIGRLPFKCDTAAQKILAHRDQPVPSLRDKRSDVPDSLERIFRRMMAKNPLDRQQSAAELIDQLYEVKVPRNDEKVGLIPVPPDGSKAETKGNAKQPAKTRRSVHVEAAKPRTSNGRMLINVVVLAVLAFITILITFLWISLFYWGH
jgi:hypothetical protein